MNDKILSVLKDRENVMNNISYNQNWDDEKLSQFNLFKKKYNELSFLERDIWYLVTLQGVTKTAKMMEVSRSFINKKMKIIREKLCLKN